MHYSNWGTIRFSSGKMRKEDSEEFRQYAIRHVQPVIEGSIVISFNLMSFKWKLYQILSNSLWIKQVKIHLQTFKQNILMPFWTKCFRKKSTTTRLNCSKLKTTRIFKKVLNWNKLKNQIFQQGPIKDLIWIGLAKSLANRQKLTKGKT